MLRDSRGQDHAHAPIEYVGLELTRNDPHHSDDEYTDTRQGTLIH